MSEVCRYCDRALNELYPAAPYELRWGHTSLEDTERCPVRTMPGEWPRPERLRTTP